MFYFHLNVHKAMKAQRGQLFHPSIRSFNKYLLYASRVQVLHAGVKRQIYFLSSQSLDSRAKNLILNNSLKCEVCNEEVEMPTGRKRIQKEAKLRLNTCLSGLKPALFVILWHLNSHKYDFPNGEASPLEAQEHLQLVQKNAYFSNKYIFSLPFIFVK